MSLSAEKGKEVWRDRKGVFLFKTKWVPYTAPMLQGDDRSKHRARELRKAMSLPEILLWRELRKRPANLKFRRQHAAGVYVADFYCHVARLIVEVDGSNHDFGDRPHRDARRDTWFAARGIETLRIPAKLVLEDMESALIAIIEVASARANHFLP